MKQKNCQNGSINFSLTTPPPLLLLRLMSHLLQILLPGTSFDSQRNILLSLLSPNPGPARPRGGPQTPRAPRPPRCWAGGGTGGDREGAAAAEPTLGWEGAGEGLRAPAAAPPAPRWGGGGGRGRYLRPRPHTPGPASAPPAPPALPPPPPLIPHGDTGGGLQTPLQTRPGAAPPTLQTSRRRRPPPRSLRTTGPSRQRPPEGRGCACRRCPRGVGEGEGEEEGARSPRQVPPSPASPEPRRRGGAAAPRSGHCL